MLLSLLATTGCINDEDPSDPGLRVGDPLPHFSVEMNNGTWISSSHLKGSVAVIVFFNTGCPDCQRELPVIEQLWNIYKDSGNVFIVPVAREESESSIEEYWVKEGFAMPYSAQETREVYNLFASSGIPRIYVADPQSTIIAAYDDNDAPGLEKLTADINDALKE